MDGVEQETDRRRKDINQTPQNDKAIHKTTEEEPQSQEGKEVMNEEKAKVMKILRSIDSQGKLLIALATSRDRGVTGSDGLDPPINFPVLTPPNVMPPVWACRDN